MSNSINPRSLDELKKSIPVIENHKSINNGYVVDVNYKGNIMFSRYENGKEIKEERIETTVLLYDTFEEFLKEIKVYVGKKKVYLTKDYAAIILAVLNGGYPEDYEE